jgi:hypothetical protein
MLLRQDFDALRHSIAKTQRAIFQDAGTSGEIFPVGRTMGCFARNDWRRRAPMRQYAGQSLTLQFSTEPLVVEFPDYPHLKFDGMLGVISAFVVKVSPLDVQLVGIRYEESTEPAAKSLGKRRQRSRYYPPACRGHAWDCLVQWQHLRVGE